MKSKLFDRVYGCLVGGIIGDAMGAPVEGMNYWEIKEKYGYVNDFEGQGTDDSAIKMILCEAIIESQGNVTADEFSEAFLRNKDKYYELFFVPVRNMVHKLESKLTLPVYAGMGNMHSSSTAMSISPMGLIHACNPRQAAIETYDVAALIHSGDTTFCRDAACAMAAAIAEAVSPAATVASVITASTAYLHKISSAEMRGLILKTMENAKKAGNYEAFRKDFYEYHLQTLICDSRETVPVALALFYLADGNPQLAIEYGANFGRDADTIGTMAGALAGAFYGVSGLKSEWVLKADGTFANAQSEKQNQPQGKSPQESLALQLMEVIEKKASYTKEKLNLYESLK